MLNFKDNRILCHKVISQLCYIYDILKLIFFYIKIKLEGKILK